MAKRGLESLFSLEKRAKSAGRPKRITAVERRQLRQRADELKAAGRSRDDIVAQFSEEFELQLSYVRRILEDHRKDE
jgi:transposase